MTDEVEPHYRRFRQFSEGERRTRVELGSLDSGDDTKGDKPWLEYSSRDCQTSYHEQEWHDKTTSSIDMKLFEKVSVRHYDFKYVP